MIINSATMAGNSTSPGHPSRHIASSPIHPSWRSCVLALSFFSSWLFALLFARPPLLPLIVSVFFFLLRGTRESLFVRTTARPRSPRKSPTPPKAFDSREYRSNDSPWDSRFRCLSRLSSRISSRCCVMHFSQDVRCVWFKMILISSLANIWYPPLFLQ